MERTSVFIRIASHPPRTHLFTVTERDREGRLWPGGDVTKQVDSSLCPTIDNDQEVADAQPVRALQ